MLRYKYFLFLISATLVLFGIAYYKLNSKSASRRLTVEAVKLRLLKEEVFLQRKGRLKQACSSSLALDEKSKDSFQELANNPQLLLHILVDDAQKVLYCYVPKVACTNWKKVLLLQNLKNITDLKQIPADSVHRKNVFLKLSDLQGEEVTKRLETYTKFLFVRHPLERLVSAYRNKFVMNYSSSAYFKKRFGVAILKRFRPPNSYPSTGDGVKFSEFVEYLVKTSDRDPKLLNEHWAPATQLCRPCEVKYDLVGKYETLENDAKFVLEEMNAPEWVKFPTVVPSKTTALVDAYVSTLTNSLFRGLMRVYEDDFNLFGYDYKKRKL